MTPGGETPSGAPPERPRSALFHADVQALFNDPRYKHLANFSDLDDSEAEQLNYDRTLTLQAAASIYSIMSAEKQGRSLARATWALVIATAGLLIATVVLVIVTVQGR